MSVVKDTIDSFTGGSQAAKAATEAARIQSRSADQAIEFQRESRDLAREDFQPFRQAGESTLPGLQDLVNDPNAQLDFVQNNPFFQSLSDQASNTLFANQAAKGKVGSGGTAAALQENLLRLGTDLVNQNVNQRFNLASLGSNAAAGQATATQQAGNNISGLTLQQGNANAAGVIGANNAIQQGRMGLLKAGGAVGGQIAGALSQGSSAAALCDRRAKTDITKVGVLDNGLPLYLFRYKGDSKLHINVMAQDVEKVMPDAVIEKDNLKYVNMRKVCR